MKRIIYFLFVTSITLGIFTVTLYEIRHWRLQDGSPQTPIVQAQVPIQPPTGRAVEAVSLETSRHNAITRAIQEVSPSVVGINVTQIRYTSSPYMNDPFWRLMMPEMPRWFTERVPVLGSGFIYDSDGFIITNAHVVEHAEEIIVTLAGGTQHEANLIGIDDKTDLALIKITDGDAFPAAILGDSDEIIIGEWVIALGNPFGLLSESRTPIATAGIVSSMHMDFGIQRGGSIYQDMIQTDASINSGNSGGPLVNARGEVVGINTFIFTGNTGTSGSIGIGFAIPVNRAMEIIGELRDQGYVDRRYTTGLTIQNIDRNLARLFGLDFTEGVIVVDVEVRSPADKAGIEKGDVIIGVDNERIRNDRDIFTYIRSQDLRRGDRLTFNLWREGERLNKTVKLEG